MDRHRSFGAAGLAVAVVFLALAGAAADAATVVGSGDYSGSRSSASGGGITVGGNWAGATSFTVSWAITQSGGLYTYVYTVSGNKVPAISHFDIEISPQFSEDDVEKGSGPSVDLDGDPHWTALATSLNVTAGNVLKFDAGVEDTNGVWSAT